MWIKKFPVFSPHIQKSTLKFKRRLRNRQTGQSPLGISPQGKVNSKHTQRFPPHTRGGNFASPAYWKGNKRIARKKKQYMLPAHHSFAQKKEMWPFPTHVLPPKGKETTSPCDRYSKVEGHNFLFSWLFSLLVRNFFGLFMWPMGASQLFSLSENEQAGSLFQALSTANTGVQCNFVQGRKSHLIFC